MENKEEMEKVVRFFTEIQTCKDMRAAFLKGVLFGIGYMVLREPNWEIIKELIQEGKDEIGWIKIEKDNFDIYRKLTEDKIKLVESMVAAN